MDPGVTILIPTYNAGKCLVEALESVFTQTFTRWQLIIIDDASTDDSLALVNSYISDPRVTLISNPHNLGPSKSLNKGLAMVNTLYTVQLRNCDWFFPYTLEVLCDCAENAPPKVGVICGNVRIVYEDAQGNVLGSVVLKNRCYRDPYGFLTSNNSLWPPFYRTKALRQIQGWPTDDPYQGRYMDERILFRLIESYDFHWIDRILYSHRIQEKNETDITMYNKVIRWAVYDSLKRWGDKFDPVFSENATNLTKVVKLLPRGTSLS